MKQIQPIFVLDKESFDSIFKMLRNHTSLPAKGYGTIASKEQISKALDKIEFDNGEVLVSKVINMLEEFYSYKLTPGLNTSLDALKREVKASRKHKKTIFE